MLIGAINKKMRLGATINSVLFSPSLYFFIPFQKYYRSCYLHINAVVQCTNTFFIHAFSFCFIRLPVDIYLVAQRLLVV